ncbi:MULTISPECIES: RNA polymerase sigma factor [unclassified Myroides]|uniref:RNA polymerase sigma factor n=1 Tax=unclassified Myroides TaxID=2642485 RepID=UPI0015FC990F|nr:MULTISPECIES: RNA polymerase sigma factor [unclassified Myroides]MBB1151060.1 RNA polymerase sigma factor [Myroides sp. NP-2]MDM1407875.1 RNA polymerase sigma factor [Myroides sp. DF42-4-2]
MKLIRLYPKKVEDYLDDLRCEKRTAQHEVYQLLSGKMLSVCRQYIQDIHYAEDVMVTAFMKVFTQVHKYEGKGSFEGWIRRIMVNESISFLRAQRPFSYLEEQVELQEVVQYHQESDLVLEEIQRLIDQLPAGCKTIFNLYVIEQYKHQEIAHMLQISEGTSKSQLAQARKLLQQQLEHLKQQGLWNGVK